MRNIKQYLTEHKADIIEDIQALVKIESPTKDKVAVDKAGSWIKDKIKSYLNIEPETIEQHETGNHIRFTVGEGEEQILLSGHFDTVWN
ncbi:M20 family peptidase, partial [Staphylococcus sp. 231237_7MaSpsaltlick]